MVMVRLRFAATRALLDLHDARYYYADMEIWRDGDGVFFARVCSLICT